MLVRQAARTTSTGSRPGLTERSRVPSSAPRSRKPSPAADQRAAPNHSEGLRPSDSLTRSLAGPREPHSARVGSLAVLVRQAARTNVDRVAPRVDGKIASAFIAPRSRKPSPAADQRAAPNHSEGLRPSDSLTRSLAGPREPHSARVGSLAVLVRQAARTTSTGSRPRLTERSRVPSSAPRSRKPSPAADQRAAPNHSEGLRPSDSLTRSLAGPREPHSARVGSLAVLVRQAARTSVDRVAPRVDGKIASAFIAPRSRKPSPAADQRAAPNHSEGLRPSDSLTRSLAGPREPHSARVGSLAVLVRQAARYSVLKPVVVTCPPSARPTSRHALRSEAGCVLDSRTQGFRDSGIQGLGIQGLGIQGSGIHDQ